MKTQEKLPMQLALAAVAVNLLAFGLTLARPAEAAEPKKDAQVERGRYLVNTSGCHDCHTPLKMGANGPEPDMSRMLSGHPAGMQMPPVPTLPQGPWLVVSSATNTAWAGPWGVSFTANLTPDAQTGLGKWSAKDFRDTIRTGRHLGRGRAILPPMPIPAYSQMTDRDLEAIFAYLRTVPAVSNAVPEPWAPAPAPVATK
jgi:mono/diheme cytochrome c family protein